MSCPHCTMHENHGLTYVNVIYSENVTAQVFRRSWGYVLLTIDSNERDGNVDVASIPIKFCPWCGEELGKAVKR